MNSKILRRACLGAAGALILSLVAVVPAWATGGAAPQGSYVPQPQADPELTLSQNPYASDPNPMGFSGSTSSEQGAEEGTLNQGPAQIDAEVGAGEHDVLYAPKGTAEHGNGANWVVQGLLILAALAVISVSIHWILYPTDQIPRIGVGGSPNRS